MKTAVYAVIKLEDVGARPEPTGEMVKKAIRLIDEEEKLGTTLEVLTSWQD